MHKPLPSDSHPHKGFDPKVHPLEWKQQLSPEDRVLLDELLANVRHVSEAMLDRQLSVLISDAVARRSLPEYDYSASVRDYRENLGEMAGFLCDRLLSELRHALAGGLQVAVANGDQRLRHALSDTVEQAPK